MTYLCCFWGFFKNVIIIIIIVIIVIIVIIIIINVISQGRPTLSNYCNKHKSYWVTLKIIIKLIKKNNACSTIVGYIL